MGSSARVGIAAALLALVATTLSWFVATPPPASAHAVVVSSSPAADELLTAGPESVRITFSERVDAAADGIDVIAPSGDHVALSDGAVSSVLELAVDVEATEQGTYTVVYRVVSADGHPVVGSFVFHVGVRSGTGVGAAEVARVDNSGGVLGVAGFVSRAMSYVGLMAVLGIAVGLFRLDAERRDRLTPTMFGPRGLGRGLAAVAVAGSAAILQIRAMTISGLRLDKAFLELPSLISDSRVLGYDLARLVLALLVLAAVVLVGHRGIRLAAIAAAAAAMALATSSLSGHASTASPAAVSVGLDLLHVLAASVWLGGLMVVIAALRADPDDPTTVQRFSRGAVGVFPVIVVTGAGSTLFHVDDLELLFSTTYGRLLLAKVLGVALIGALALMNRRLIAEFASGAQRLIATITMERDVALMVIAITSVLVFSVPAVRYDVAAPPTPFEATTQTASTTVRLRVSPAVVGDNSVEVTFTDAAGAARPVDVAVLDISTDAIPARKVPLELGDGSVGRATGVSFGVPARWTVAVRLSIDGVSETATFTVEIR